LAAGVDADDDVFEVLDVFVPLACCVAGWTACLVVFLDVRAKVELELDVLSLLLLMLLLLMLLLLMLLLLMLLPLMLLLLMLSLLSLGEGAF